MHGAEIVEVSGNFDQALSLANEAAKAKGFALVNSSNPFRIEGQKTGAFEIVEQLGRAPANHFMPVGNAGNITAYWKGYRELDLRPRMFGWQAAGAAPIVLGRVIKDPTTIATAIRIGNPVSWKTALAARDESGGAVDQVTDSEIFKLAKAGRAPAGVTVCVLTGHGLKDPGVTLRFKPKIRRVKAGGAVKL
jgi:threonine synthase